MPQEMYIACILNHTKLYSRQTKQQQPVVRHNKENKLKIHRNTMIVITRK